MAAPVCSDGEKSGAVGPMDQQLVPMKKKTQLNNMPPWLAERLEKDALTVAVGWKKGSAPKVGAVRGSSEVTVIIGGKPLKDGQTPELGHLHAVLDSKNQLDLVAVRRGKGGELKAPDCPRDTQWQHSGRQDPVRGRDGRAHHCGVQPHKARDTFVQCQ